MPVSTGTQATYNGFMRFFLDDARPRALATARREYRSLLDRGYRAESALRLVGDHRQLSSTERAVLYRGAQPSVSCAALAPRLLRDVRGQELHVDAYNILFGIVSRRAGKACFVSDDSLLRDAGGIHGRLGDQGVLEEACAALVSTLADSGAARTILWLDEPVSRSARHAAVLNGLLAAVPSLAGSEARLARSADAPLRAAESGVLCSADTGILGATTLPVFDLLKNVVADRFGDVPAALADLELPSCAAPWIRALRTSDLPELGLLDRDLGYDYPESALPERLAAVLQREDDLVLVAAPEGRAEGYIHIAPYQVLYAEPLWNILALVVSRERRGEGFGRSLLEAAEHAAAERGAAALRLSSGAERLGAHRFYRAAGYRELKDHKTFIKPLK